MLENYDIRKPEGKWIEIEKKIILSEVNLTERDKHSMFSLIRRY